MNRIRLVYTFVEFKSRFPPENITDETVDGTIPEIGETVMKYNNIGSY